MSNLWKDHKANLDGSMAFTPEDVKAGRMTRFMKCLMEMDCEFVVCTDGYCWIVEYLDSVKAQDGVRFYAINREEYECACETFDEEE